jgi:hypothetical protein
MPKRSRWPPPSPPLPASNAAPAPIQLGKPFVRASLEPADSDFSLFYSNQATPKIANRLIALLAVEAPIQQREATIRVTQCWNSKAFSQKAHERLLTIASSLQQQQRLFRNDEDTLWVSRSQYEQWEGFRLPPDSSRTIDSVPMAERRGALLLTHGKPSASILKLCFARPASNSPEALASLSSNGRPSPLPSTN